MNRLNCAKIRLVLAGFVAAIVLCGGSAKAEIIMSEPVNLGPVINDAYNVQECDFSHDGLQLYFAVWGRPDGFGSGDIYMAERATLNSPWEEPVNLGSNVNSSGREIEPSISGDGLELYFGSWDDYILRVCTRPSKDAPWGSPVKIGPPVGSDVPAMEIGSNDAWSPDISADGLSLYFSSTRVGGFGDGDIWVAKRATKDDPWGEPVNLGPNVNTYSNDWSPNISTDDLTLTFSRGFMSIWITTRKSVNDVWGPAVKLDLTPPPGQWNQFFAPALSPDGTALYFRASLAWGGFGEGDFWQVDFIPIVDFNGDGLVNSADMCIMVDCWGTDKKLCDIGPMPWGDGVVDVEDLKVLAEHLFEDYRLIAHWMLDEEAGETAHDSVGNYNGTLNGEPLWQPEGGILDGALEFDGNDDYMRTPFVLNPGKESFSVFAWIKGGAPEHVIISQSNTTGGRGVFPGCTWLGISPSNGNLMTGLMETTFGPLETDSIITDGQWHHIGLVYDLFTMRRHLYLDGAEVAADTDFIGGVQTTGGLYIGAGQALDAGTFFSGLIDDVRIYNVVLTAEEIAALAQ